MEQDNFWSKGQEKAFPGGIPTGIGSFGQRTFPVRMRRDLCLFLANPVVHLISFIRKAFSTGGRYTLVSIKLFIVKRGNTLCNQTDWLLKDG